MPLQKHKSLEERGFASIVIALILVIILALFTVGFAQLARREQRSALDKLLATSASNAAESGVNEAVKNLATFETSPPDPDTCVQMPGHPPGPVNIGPAEDDVQYTCVLVNVKPPVVKYSNVQPEDSRYITTTATSTAGGAATLTVNWGSNDGNTNFPGSMGNKFLPAAQWNDAAHKYPAVLEFSITPLNDVSRAGLLGNMFTAFLYPTSTGLGSVAYNPANTGQRVAARCDSAASAQYPCHVTISGLTGGAGKYLFRIINHYDASNVLINGKDGIGKPVGFDGQITIDATGKTHEVLRRVQVSRPKKPSYDIPAAALESQSTCKHFETDPASTSPVSLSQDSAGACALN